MDVGLGRAQYVRLLLPFEQCGSANTVQAILNNNHPLPKYIVNFTVNLECSQGVRTLLYISHRHTCGLNSEEFSDQTSEARRK